LNQQIQRRTEEFTSPEALLLFVCVLILCDNF